MTDTHRPDAGPQTDGENNTGKTRPDQGGTLQPGQEKPDPATGGEGAAGAGGSKGFGT